MTWKKNVMMFLWGLLFISAGLMLLFQRFFVFDISIMRLLIGGFFIILGINILLDPDSGVKDNRQKKIENRNSQ